MASLYADFIKETASAPGTGTFTLAGAVAGFAAFSSAFTNATQPVAYSAFDGTNWETGIGVYTLSGTTLTRAVVLSSSNAGALVNFTGTTTIICSLATDNLVDLGTVAAIESRMLAM